MLHFIQRKERWVLELRRRQAVSCLEEWTKYGWARRKILESKKLERRHGPRASHTFSLEHCSVSYVLLLPHVFALCALRSLSRIPGEVSLLHVLTIVHFLHPKNFHTVLSSPVHFSYISLSITSSKRVEMRCCLIHHSLSSG